MLTKTCNKCSEVKELGQFHVSKNNRDGVKDKCRVCCSEANKIDYAFNKEKYQCQNMYSKYGVTLDTYKQMAEKQANLCAICEQSETVIYKGEVRPLAVDHNHVTGHLRGLLCMSCNTLLGHYEGSPDWTDLADDYLIEHDRSPSGITRDNKESGMHRVKERTALTDDEIREIIKEYETYSLADVATKHGVSMDRVINIITRHRR